MPSSHFNAAGDAHMVDISAKVPSVRTATASGEVRVHADAATAIRQGSPKKGDVLAVARLAAIQATKATSTLIPLCHAIPIEAVSVDFDWPQPDRIRCCVTVRTTAKTGVEMEALTAASVACLTIYDMVKSIQPGAVIGPLRLVHKTGGSSGDFRDSDDSRA